jgi:hypothetical protein
MTRRDPVRIADLPDAAELAATIKSARACVPGPAALEALSARLEHSLPTETTRPPTNPAKTGLPAGKLPVAPTLGVLGVIAGAVIVALLIGKSKPNASHAPPARPAPAASAASESRPVARAQSPTATLPTPTPQVASTASARSETQEAAKTQPKPARMPTELELITLAERALRSNPAAALRMTDEHARRFAKGGLTEEREVLAIEALSRLGDTERARARARAFLHAFPASVYRRRVERATSAVTR